jgi:hypothetical protein
MAKHQRVEIPARAEVPVCSDREETEALSPAVRESTSAADCATLQFVRQEVRCGCVTVSVVYLSYQQVSSSRQRASYPLNPN